MPEPFYVYFPSVRPMVARTLSHWFTQALEAKADENVLDKLVKAAQTIPDRDTKKMLAKMRGRLQNRKLMGNIEFPHEIHLIVTDTSQFYLGKPWEQTHGPALQQMAKVLNSIGNTHGIFVHYISGQRLLQKTPPDQIDFENDPVFHWSKNRWMVSPNGGANFTLGYIQADAALRKAARVNAMKMDDDMIPAWRKGKTGAFNYFKEMKNAADNPRSNERFTEFAGFHYGLDRPVRFRFLAEEKRRATDSFYSAIYSGNATQFRTFDTGYSQYFPTSRSMKVTWLPAGLLHLGGISTYPWKGKRAFFGYHKGFDPVKPLSMDLALEIRKDSGIAEKRPKP